MKIQDVWNAYEQGKSSPSQLVLDYFKKIKASQHNAYLTLCEDRALKQAKVQDEILKKESKVPRDRLPLFGIPLGIKDALVIDQVRTTCASKILENYIPPYTATCVSRLEEAGAIVLGKLNMDEFAMGGSNENSAFGPVMHPTHPGYVPGGSSGGSAAAVGADLCVAALGSDTGGSIRLPAHYSGIVGFKPTYGRVSRYGLVAFASSLDQVGPMTKSVDDAHRILKVMSGFDEKDSTSARTKAIEANDLESMKPDFKGIKIGIPKEYFVQGLDPEVEASVKSAIAWYQQHGATCVEIELPHTQHAVAVYYLVAVSEASSNLSRYDGVRFGSRTDAAENAKNLDEFYKKVRSQFGPEVKRRILLGTFALSSGYYDAYYTKACQVRHLIKKDFDRAFSKVDVIMGPVSTTTAYRLGEKSKDPLQMYLNDILTIPVNLAGLPAASIPCGQNKMGLPIGFQMIGPAFEDERLIRLAYAFEQKGLVQ